MFIVRYVVQPLPGSDHFTECSGAYVNVWTEAATETEALDVAAAELRQAGWRIDSLDAVHPTERDDYDDDAAGLQYFEQARIDGIVLVFHAWRDAARH